MREELDGFSSGMLRGERSPSKVLSDWYAASGNPSFDAFVDDSLDLRGTLARDEAQRLLSTSDVNLQTADLRSRLRQESPVPGTFLARHLAARLPSAVASSRHFLKSCADLGQTASAHRIVELTAEEFEAKRQLFIEREVSGLLRSRTHWAAESTGSPAQPSRLYDTLATFLQGLGTAHGWHIDPECAIARLANVVGVPVEVLFVNRRPPAGLSPADLAREIACQLTVLAGGDCPAIRDIEALAQEAFRSGQDQAPAWRDQSLQLGDLLRSLRLYQDLSQDEVARRMRHGNRQRISRWENGHTDSLEGPELRRLACLYRLSADQTELLTRVRWPALEPQWLSLQPDAERFPLFLAACRQRLGMSREQLADRVGIHPEFYRRWEDGYRTPDEQRSIGLLRALQLATEETGVFLGLRFPTLGAKWHDRLIHCRGLIGLDPAWLAEQQAERRFGYYLEATRKLADLPLADLAARLDVTKQAVEQWSAGKTTPLPSKFEKLKTSLDEAFAQKPQVRYHFDPAYFVRLWQESGRRTGLRRSNDAPISR